MTLEETENTTTTRYYIGLLDGLHFMFKVGPAEESTFHHGPQEPVELGDLKYAYPVSADIAEEWVRDE